MANFRADSQGGTLGTVEIFAIDPKNKNRIQWIDSVVHPLFTSNCSRLIKHPISRLFNSYEKL